MENKTYDELIEAVKQDGYALEHIEEQDENLCTVAVQENGYAIRYAKDQTERVCVAALGQNGNAIRYINKPSFEMKRLAVLMDGLSIRYIDEEDERNYHYLCTIAINQNAFAINFIDEQTYELCLQAVQKNGDMLWCVEEQTKEICTEALRNNLKAFKHIRNITEEHILLFLKLCNEKKYKRESDARGVVNECKDNCKYLIKNLNLADRRRLFTERVLLEFVKFDGMLLEHLICFQNDELCVTALKENPNAFKFVCPSLRTKRLVNIVTNSKGGDKILHKCMSDTDYKYIANGRKIKSLSQIFSNQNI